MNFSNNYLRIFKAIFFLTLLLAVGNLDAKTLIMTHCYNRPEFIGWQAQSFHKFLKEDYEFIVFNDAPNLQLRNEAAASCRQHNVPCVLVPQSIHQKPYYLAREPGVGGASAECAETVQYMLNTMGFDYPGIVVVIDSDMFLVRPFSIVDYLQDNQLAAHPQVRYGKHGAIHYFLPNLMFFNMNTLPDKKTLSFNLGKIDGEMVDTGGHTYYYLKNHPYLKWEGTTLQPRALNEKQTHLEASILKHIQSYPKLHYLVTKLPHDMEFYIDYAFLHFKAGSNWNQIDNEKMKEKTRAAYEVMEELILTNN
jgi:hypothetical protein